MGCVALHGSRPMDELGRFTAYSFLVWGVVSTSPRMQNSLDEFKSLKTGRSPVSGIIPYLME